MSCRSKVVAAAVLLAGVGGPAFGKTAATSPRGNPGQFFGPDEYPPEAIRLKQEGRVVAKLWIDTTGKVASCTVEISSGSLSLDHKTCEIALARVTYAPARDRRGRPVAAPVTLPVRWVLPNGPIEATTPGLPLRWTMDMTFSVNEAGIVQACSARAVPPPPGDATPCDQNPVGSQTEFHWVRNGRPVGGTITRHMKQEVTIDP